MSGKERGKVLMKLADLIEQNADELASIEALVSAWVGTPTGVGGLVGLIAPPPSLAGKPQGFPNPNFIIYLSQDNGKPKYMAALADIPLSADHFR